MTTPFISPENSLSSTVARHLKNYFAAHEQGLPSSGLYGRILEEVERPLLQLTLEQCHGNQLKAAEVLGLNRNTLRKKIRELGLAPRRRRSFLDEEGAA